MRKTLKHVLTEYGAIALVLYLLIFFVVFFGFWLAIEMGFRDELNRLVATMAGWFGMTPTSSAGGGAAAWVLAYVSTKLVQPLRIGLTIVLTPIVAQLYERVTGRKGGPGADPSPRSG